jgi:hypothetical protein
MNSIVAPEARTGGHENNVARLAEDEGNALEQHRDAVADQKVVLVSSHNAKVVVVKVGNRRIEASGVVQFVGNHLGTHVNDQEHDIEHQAVLARDQIDDMGVGLAVPIGSLENRRQNHLATGKCQSRLML